MTSKKNDIYRLIVGFIYVLFFIYLLFFASFRDGTTTAVNLIPFKSTYELISPIFTSTFIPGIDYFLYVFMILAGNFLLLLPIPIIFKLDWRGPKKWAVIFTIPFSIELLQYAFEVGSADIDDVILNAAGFILGFRLREKRI